MEYWSFQVVVFLVLILINFIQGVIPLYYGIFTILIRVFLAAMLLPSLAVTSRRLHDVGHSGLMILILLLPIIGWIWLLVLLFKDSQHNTNQWGYNPKKPHSDIDIEVDFIGTE